MNGLWTTKFHQIHPSSFEMIMTKRWVMISLVLFVISNFCLSVGWLFCSPWSLVFLLRGTRGVPPTILRRWGSTCTILRTTHLFVFHCYYCCYLSYLLLFIIIHYHSLLLFWDDNGVLPPFLRTNCLVEEYFQTECKNSQHFFFGKIICIKYKWD